jgi:hypothetical protein
MKSSGKAFFGSIVMSMILIAGVVSLVAATPPMTMMGFEGTLTIDGLAASAGTQVKGLANGIDNTVNSPYTTDNPGMYGDNPLNRFKIYCTDGDTITFSVEVSPGVFELADQSDVCETGTDVWLDLTVGEPQGEPEICDGIDNDYDGEIDEDFPDLGDPCSAGIGECQADGVMVCTVDGSGTECSATPGIPSAELCDGLDNNCDGDTDEDFPDLGEPCSDGVGECQVFGEMVCTIDGTGTECSVTAGTGEAEICDGIDNDCDGETDEDFPDLGDPCSAGIGECEDFGEMICTIDGTGTECSAVAGVPSAEICNGLDDDCDGSTDNGIAPRSCGLTNVGVCTYGVETCDMGDWVGCTAILPSAEICTGELDEDCDGYTDCDDTEDCEQDPACGEEPEEFCIEILSMRILNNDFIEDYYIMPGEMYSVEVVNYNACEEPVESMQIVQVDKIGNTPVNIGTVKSTIAPYSTSTVTVGFVLPGVGMGTDFEAYAYNWNHWISQNPSTWEALSEPALVAFEAGTGPL